MPKPKIIFVAAVAKNGVIGKRNSLPWYLPEDLKRFKQITTGKNVLMGKNTFDSIINRLGKPLPDRKNIVVTTKHDQEFPENVTVLHHLEPILNHPQIDELYVIGGGQMYKQLIDSADKLHLTHVHDDIDGDVLFPEINWDEWKKTFEETHDKFTFADYVRI